MEIHEQSKVLFASRSHCLNIYMCVSSTVQFLFSAYSADRSFEMINPERPELNIRRAFVDAVALLLSSSAHYAAAH